MNQIAVNPNIGAFMKDIERHPLLSREEEFSLAARYWQNGDLEAAHKLVTSNLRFVVRIARQYASYADSLTDLIQEGSIGLMTAVKKFNPHRGYRLISYAVWWIRARMQEHIMRFRSNVRIGRSRKERKLFQKISDVKTACAFVGEEKETGIEKLSEMLGVKPDEISAMEIRTSGRDFSLDREPNGTGTGAYINVVADSSPSQETVIAEQESEQIRKKSIAEAVKTLDDREREIITSRLLKENPDKLEDLGDRFGVSAERVRQIEAGAISKIKRFPAVKLAKKLT